MERAHVPIKDLPLLPLHRGRRSGARVGVAVLALLAGLPAAAAFREETAPLQLANGRTLQARLRIPDPPAAQMPALMLFGGFKGAARVLDLIVTDEPIILASFDYPFDPPRKFRFPESLSYAPQMRDAIAGTFEGIELLDAQLRARSDVDPARITVVGASAGAPFATVAGSRRAIPGVILVHGFGQLRDVVAHQLVRKYQPRHGAWVRHPARWLSSLVLWYLEPPDIEAHAQRMHAGQKVLMVSAREDSFIPRPASEALWQALQRSPASSERIELAGDHLRGDGDAQIAEILQRSLVWMRAQGLR